MPSPDSLPSDGAAPTSDRWPRRWVLALGASAFAVALVASGYDVGISGGIEDTTALDVRQDEVKERGASVMPFDLDRTEHVFNDLPDGGEQTVTALDATETTQIRLIRDHLQAEATKFRAGDFGDPAAIHGADMPGLAELRDGVGRVAVTYTALPDGARLRYTTTEPQLIEGIHSWFQAQSMDHGTS